MADALTRMLTLPEPDHPDLPAENWPHVVAALTETSFTCRTKDKSSGNTEKTSQPEPKAPVSTEASAAGGTRLPHATKIVGHSQTRHGGSSGHHTFSGVFPLHHVLAYGLTRRSGQGQSSLSGGEQRGTIPSPPKVPSLKRNRKVTFKSDNLATGSLPKSKISLNTPAEGRKPSQLSQSMVSTPANLCENTGESGKCLDDHQTRTVDPISPNQAFHEYDRIFENLFERIRSNLSFDPETATDEKRLMLNLHSNNDLLWRDNKLYIPPGDQLREDLLYWHHDVPWCSHLGIEKTME